MASDHELEPLALLTQSQFLLGIGEATQFADAFQNCVLPQERAKVRSNSGTLSHPRAWAKRFRCCCYRAESQKNRPPD